MITRLLIEELGAQGDGVAHTPAGPVYVPYTLPGEVVSAEVSGQRGRLLAVESASPDRREPASPHFGVCGGCAVQHLAPEPYAAWKRDKVVRALQSRGLGGEVDPLVRCPPGSRRRVTLTARIADGRTLLGFNAAQSHRIVEISDCPVALPQITRSLDDLRQLAALLATGAKPLRLTVTVSRSGLDIAANDVGKLAETRRRHAADLVIAKGFARLSIGDEIVIEREKPTVLFGEVAVAVPPGGFLQATVQAEETMAALVTGHLEGVKYVADLFAGSGTFALRLAGRCRVHAVEGDGAALGALEEGARRAIGLKPVTSERRDLFNRPLLARELDAFDGVVFDPPRAGAEAQCRQIARSKVKRIAAVSCNPGTLARDLSILVEGGYRIIRVTPIDQFLWSPHVEVVALLERRGARG